MYGLTRGTMTLVGAAGAGLLLWLASQLEADSLGGYWTYVGLTAAAGLTMAFSQLLGGWTKWGMPRLTRGVFLLGFLPALVAGGIVLLAAQPDRARGAGLAGDLGVEGLAQDLTSVLPAIAFGLGLLFGFTFDTTGRRARAVDVVDERADVRRGRPVTPAPVDSTVADEPVAGERAELAPRPARAHTESNGNGVSGERETAATDRTAVEGNGRSERDDDSETEVGAQTDVEQRRRAARS
jgi:hypothetical protein